MYILKFILLWLLPPGCILFLLLLLTVYFFKHKIRCRFLLASITIVLYCLSISPTAYFLTHYLEKQYSQPPAVNADAIVVLGGGVVTGVQDAGENGALTAISMNRLAAGARLQKVLNIPVIVTGGKVFDESAVEAAISRRVLMQFGISEDNIYTDTEALNTRQNAENAIAICRRNGWQRLVVVTSAIHMPRAMQNFNAAAENTGMELTAYPCDYLTNERMHLSVFSFVPQSYALDLTSMAVKEYLALTAGEFL